MLGSFTIREFVRDLGPDDRIIYLEIVGFSVGCHGVRADGHRVAESIRVAEDLRY